MADITNFKNEWLGRRVDFDHVFAYQCVDLILQYVYEVYGLTAVRGNAIDYWNNPSPALISKFHKLASTDAIAGDIVVLNGHPGNPYGHIGIATGNVNATEIEILEQNGQDGSGSGIGGNAIRTRFILKNRVAGLLRANDVPAAAAPAPAAGPSYAIVVNVPGYTDSNDAANHINPNGSVVGPGKYYVYNQAHGMVNVSAHQGAPGEWINPSDNQIPATPAPAPAAPAPEKPANTIYTKLAQPMSLVVNKNPTSWWNLGFVNDAHATAAAILPQGTPFRAFGKAQRTDGDRPAYFMTEEDFGQADVTGAPVNNNGVNTVDLSPAPAPVAAAAGEGADQPTAPKLEATPVAQPTVIQPATADHIPVTVVPSAPDAWKNKLDPSTAGEYIANADTKVYDLADPNAEAQQLVKGQKVNVAGSFTGPDKIEYYRTVKATADGTYRGIPKVSLSAENLLSDAATLLNPTFIDESRRVLGKYSNKEKAIKKLVATETSSLLQRFKKH